MPVLRVKEFMSDADFKGNEKFRKKMLQYVRAKAEEKAFDYSEDRLWEIRDKESFELSNSKSLNIAYMFKYSYSGCDMYVARESVIYIFADDKEASAFKQGVFKMTFPEADSKLSRCFPELKMELALKDGRKALAYVRRPGFYPAELLLHGRPCILHGLFREWKTFAVRWSIQSFSIQT